MAGSRLAGEVVDGAGGEEEEEAEEKPRRVFARRHVEMPKAAPRARYKAASPPHPPPPPANEWERRARGQAGIGGVRDGCQADDVVGDNRWAVKEVLSCCSSQASKQSHGKKKGRSVVVSRMRVADVSEKTDGWVVGNKSCPGGHSSVRQLDCGAVLAGYRRAVPKPSLYRFRCLKEWCGQQAQTSRVYVLYRVLTR
ncbi:hypothetical protein VTG60DRAFT_5744 [Thermothelomyces hinnuleus]